MMRFTYWESLGTKTKLMNIIIILWHLIVITSLHEGVQFSYSRGSESRTRKLRLHYGDFVWGEFQHGGQNSWSTRVDATCQQRLCEGF